MMHESSEPLLPVVTAVVPPPLAPAPPRKGWTKLSWLVIVGVVGALIALRALPEHGGGETGSTTGRVDLAVLRVHLQLLVAIRRLSPDNDPGDLYESARQVLDGDPAKALRFSAFTAEMLGPKEALKEVAALRESPRQGAAWTPQDDQLRDVLRRLYQDQARGAFYHPSVSDEEARLVRARLGWFGSLALHPEMTEAALKAGAAAAGAQGPALLERYREGRREVLAQAVRTLFVLAAFGGGACLLMLLGLVLLPLFLLLALGGAIRIGLRPGMPHAGVYAETFALWLVIYAGMLLLGDLYLHDVVPLVARGAVAMPLSLLVLGWPVLRGVPWRQVREDIGWTAGRQPLLEPLAGLTCYVTNLPVVALGFLLTLGLAAGYAAWERGGAGEGGAPPAPSHPALQELANPDWPSLILLFFLLSVVAPVVEETMFRGVLHRSLRASAFPARPLLGGLATALVVNLVFASVHPQGPLFIPVLTAMAFGFSLAREWRGTLIPGMVAHGTNNFLVGLLGYFLLGS